MDVNNNHLVSREYFEDLTDEEKENYIEVPERLSLQAQLELMGKEETTVGKESTGSINKWAKTKRQKLKSKLKKRKANKLHCN